jgi:hypothetical protein
LALAMTRSPSLVMVTCEPTASMIPTAPCPKICGATLPNIAGTSGARQIESVTQAFAAVIFRRTSWGPSSRRVTGSTAIGSPRARQTAACMVRAFIAA